MSANLLNFAYQAGMSFFIYGLLSRWYVMPFLQRLSTYDALQVLLVPYLFRQVGGIYLAPTVIPHPPSYALAWATLLGDLICMLAALVALAAIRQRSEYAIPLVWLFTGLDLADYALIATWGGLAGVVDYFGPHWYVVTYYDTLLGVLQVLIIIVLLKRQSAGGLA